MLTFSTADGLSEIEPIVRQLMGKYVPKRKFTHPPMSVALHVFGARDRRSTDLVISPHIPEAADLVELLTGVGFSAKIEQIGTTTRKTLGLRTSFRRRSPALAAKAVLIVYMFVNDRLFYVRRK